MDGVLYNVCDCAFISWGVGHFWGQLWLCTPSVKCLSLPAPLKGQGKSSGMLQHPCPLGGAGILASHWL